MMTNAELKNAKIDAITALEAKYNRVAKALATPGVDKAAIDKILNKIHEQIASLESELTLIG